MVVAEVDLAQSPSQGPGVEGVVVEEEGEEGVGEEAVTEVATLVHFALEKRTRCHVHIKHEKMGAPNSPDGSSGNAS